MPFRDILNQLESVLGVGPLLNHDFEIEERPVITETRFRADEAATAICLAGGLLTSRIWEAQGGKKQKVRVNSAHAALALQSYLLQTQSGYPVSFADSHRNWPSYPIVNAYRAKDGRFIFINGGYPHLRDGLLDFLDCANNEESLSKAISRFGAEELEFEINSRRLCAAVVRTQEEWLRHPQGRLLAMDPIIKIRKIKPGPVVPFHGGEQPLSGIRVIDLTHVLAGPMSTRALAGQGADVLHVSSPSVFEHTPFMIDTGHGKRNTYLDLKRGEDSEKLKCLVKDADIFVDGYRPGSMARLGFGPEEVHKMRDGMIYCTLSCYGTEGPFGGWGGFEQLAQATSGLMAAHSSVDAPKLVPAAISDYLTGYLTTLGMLAALLRRSTEGGSYHVEVCLTRTAMWVQELGLRPENLVPVPLQKEQLEDFLMDSPSSLGTIRHLKPVTQFSLTPPRFHQAVTSLGSSPAIWRP